MSDVYVTEHGMYGGGSIEYTVMVNGRPYAHLRRYSGLPLSQNEKYDLARVYEETLADWPELC